MAKTAQQKLDEVEAAITEVLTLGQSMKLPDREVTRADLPQLRRLEKEYRLELARELRGGIRSRRGVPYA